MAATVYLKPGGFVWGRAAGEAAQVGLAGRIGSGAAGFTMLEVIERKPGKVQREWRGYRDLKASREPAVAERLALIEAPRSKLAGLELTWPRIMGIVNVTPDSFSDGGEHPDPASAIAHGRALAAGGADILDVGGESTRPYAEPLPFEAERARALPVVEALVGGGHLVSIDTRKAAMMRDAVAAGAAIINDVSALGHDPGSLAAARELGVSVVLMHAQGDPATMQVDPRYDDAALDIFDALAARIAACEAAGLARTRLLADPGFGFGKTVAHNVELLGSLALFHSLGVALVAGASRKGFIGKLTGEPVGVRRIPGSLGAALAAVCQGVQVIRVHDVAETRQALAVWLAAMHLQALPS